MKDGGSEKGLPGSFNQQRSQVRMDGWMDEWMNGWIDG